MRIAASVYAVVAARRSKRWNVLLSLLAAPSATSNPTLQWWRVAMSLERCVAHLNHQELRVIAPDAREMLVEWWNVSRQQKHGSNAVWSELAFSLSVRRVGRLPAWHQLELAEAGIEHGWQALKPEYLKGVKPPAAAGFVPQSASMQEAITAWNGRAR